RECAEGVRCGRGGAAGHRRPPPPGNAERGRVRGTGRPADSAEKVVEGVRSSCAIVFRRKSFSPPHLVSGAPSSLIEPRDAAPERSDRAPPGVSPALVSTSLS